MKEFIFLIVLLILPTFAFAQEGREPVKEEHPIDKFLGACIEKDSSTSGMSTCTDQAQEMWDVEMNKYYKLLMKMMDKEGKEKLRASQRSWIKFRDAEFEATDSLYPHLGTMYTTLRASERLAIVKDRATTLRGYYEIWKTAKD